MTENENIWKEGNRGAYRAYLLRCWQEKGSGEALWRFTLVGVGEERTQKCFASLEDLTAFLREELTTSSTGT